MRPITIWNILTREERKVLRVLMALVVLAALLEAVTMAVIYPFLVVAANPDAVTGSSFIATMYAYSGLGSTQRFLLALGSLILVLVVLNSVVGATTACRQEVFVRRFEHNLATRLFGRFLHKPYRFFLENNTGELQRRLVRDVAEISQGAVYPSLEIVARGTAALAIFAVLLIIEPVLTIATASVLALIFAGFYAFGRQRLRVAGREAWSAGQAAAWSSAEALSAVKAVKVARRENHFVQRFQRSSSESAHWYALNGIYGRLPRYIIEGTSFAVVMTVFLIVLATGRSTLSMLPTMGMLAFAGFRLMPSVHGILASVGRLRFSDVLVDSVRAHLDDTPQADPSARIVPLPFRNDLRFEAVSFAYTPEGRTILKDIRLTIPRGTTAGLVGTTGSGKTTMMDLVLGLLEPTSGAITVDGKPLVGTHLRRWQETVAYVPQQVVLIDDTVTRNIAFGIPDEGIDMDRVHQAARAANIHDFVTTHLVDGYETMVGDRGIRLSGGQRQRIGIARALYEERPVIVFDEATSEVDTATERAITEAIERISAEKTVIIIAHRHAAIRNCDQIILLDGGRIAATGRYEELFASDAPFAHVAEAPV